MDQQSKRGEAIKMLEENTGINICDHGLGDGFLDMTPKAQTKIKIKLNIIKVKISMLQRTLLRN